MSDPQIESVPLDQLHPAPWNPRMLTDVAFRSLVQSVKDDPGLLWLQPILAMADGTIWSGNMRYRVAKHLGMTTVPAIIDDIPEKLAKERALKANNQWGDWQRDELAEMLYNLAEEGSAIDTLGFDSKELATLLASVGVDDDPDDPEDAPSDLPGAAALKRDMHFDSDLPWDIPELRTDMLAECPANLASWAGPQTPDHGGAWFYQWRSDSVRGLDWSRTYLGFYVDDRRFLSFWDEPDRYVSKLLNLGLTVAVAPNYSLWGNESRAAHLWAVFRSRWTARYMQEAGIKVIPDMNWADERSFEFCLLGIPQHVPCLSVQLQTLKHDDEWERARTGLLTGLDLLKPESLLIYGGPPALRRVPDWGIATPYVTVENRVARRRELMEVITS